MQRVRLIPVIAVVFGIYPWLATALPDTSPEVDIRFLGAGPDLIELATGGWPLSLLLTMNESKLVGIGRPFGSYPTSDQAGFLVFEDLDGCPSWDPFHEDLVQTATVGESLEDVGGAYSRCSEWRPLPWPRDEKVLEVSPGRAVLPTLDECARPEIFTFNFHDADRARLGNNSWRKGIGPCVGQEFLYGPNRRLPGLMVVADHGVGVWTDLSFDRPNPIVARNLAGLFESVTFTLKDANGRTSVNAFMNVQAELFSPVILVDDFPGALCAGAPGPMIKVDGGPATCDLDPETVLGRPITVRAFVVNGQAPDRLVDKTRDGVVDSHDAAAAGLELLSNEARIRFRLVHPEGFFWWDHFDFDGNGDAGGPPPLPAGPADLTPPPR